MLKSLKNRILAFFMVVAFAIACTVFPLNYFHNKKQLAIRETVGELNDIYIMFAKDLKHTSEFITLDITNSKFYITGESRALNAHFVIKDSLLSVLNFREQRIGAFSPVNRTSLEQLRHQYIDYCTHVDSTILFMYKRGFRSFGLEGKLRTSLLLLEKNNLPQKDIIEIKKIETAYLSTTDAGNAEKLVLKINSLLLGIQHNPYFTSSNKQLLIANLKDYRQIVEQLFEMDKRLGLRTNSGLKSALIASGDKFEVFLHETIQAAKQEEVRQMSRLNMIFAGLSALIFLSAIGLSIVLSRRLVNHLEKLTRYISQLSANNFNYTTEKLSLRRSSKEIRAIYSEFRNMVAQLKIREKQRDHAYEDIRESEKRYRELADLLPQSIFEADNLGNLIYANKAWYKAFGFSEVDLKDGLNLIEILQTNHEDNLFGINRVENSDYIAIRKDNSRFPALVYADTIKKDEKVLGRRGIIIDATLRNRYIEGLKRETARALTSDKLKSSFLANMSHEIRTPMNSIIGFANLLAAPEIPDDQKADFVEYIQSSGKILLNLIDDIIDIAKIEAGEIKIKTGTCKPASIINELLHTFEGYKNTLGKTDIELSANILEDDIAFKTDAFRLNQILSNLISNAIKFTESGSVQIGYKVKKERIIEFSVEDTGVGMSKDELNSIFDRFSRTLDSEEKNITGTGLGLSISKHLVELLGGQMWVSSVPGEGTRFWFELPFTRIPTGGSSARRVSTLEEKELYNWAGYTILVAEDDERSFLFIKEILQKTGARIVHAVNGKEVVEAVKFTDQIEMVLMDIQMPFIDGLEATKAIKKIRPGLPVIAQTAQAMEGDREKSILAGCDDYLSKPINPSNLLAKMSQFMPDHPLNKQGINKESREENIKSDTGKTRL